MASSEGINIVELLAFIKKVEQSIDEYFDSALATEARRLLHRAGWTTFTEDLEDEDDR